MCVGKLLCEMPNASSDNLASSIVLSSVDWCVVRLELDCARGCMRDVRSHHKDETERQWVAQRYHIDRKRGTLFVLRHVARRHCSSWLQQVP